MSNKIVIDNKYEIQREIKRGGFGVIFKGVDLLFGKPVAIKAVDPALLDEAKYIDMFQAEALNIARLNHHNIVHIYDIKRGANGQFYIIMEYIDGPDLHSLLRACRKAKRKLPSHLISYIIAEVSAGIDFAHNRRDLEKNRPLSIIHQDISPSNIMITRTGEIRIIDFGMANFRKEQAKKKEVTIHGKVNYLAPEQIKQKGAIDCRVDIFALGLVLYECLVGKRLFNKQKNNENIEQILAGSWDLSTISSLRITKKLKEVVRKSLQYDKSNRYQSANHMYMDLRQDMILTSPAMDLKPELSQFIEDIFAESDRLKHMTPVDPTPHSGTVKDMLADAEDDIVNGWKKAEADGIPSEEMGPEDESPTIPSLLDISESNVAAIEQSTSEFEQPSEKRSIDIETPATSNGKFHENGNYSIIIEEYTDKNENETVEESYPEEELVADDMFQDPPGAEMEVKVDESVSERQGWPNVENENSATKIPAIELIESEDIGSEAKNEAPVSEYFVIDEEQEENDDAFDDDDEDDVKTIIDVVRLSARNHKKAIMVSGLSILLAFVTFMSLDTFMHWTPWGIGVYDYFFPPAIKISSVPSGAQVYLDDKPLPQTTPLKIDQIQPGVHKLMLSLPRFGQILKSIHVPSNGVLKIQGENERDVREPFVFHFKNQLELSSRPPGAAIYINGRKLIQKTPTTVLWEVEEVPMHIEMELPGFPKLSGISIDGISGKEEISDRRFWKFQKLDHTKDHFAIEGIFRKSVQITSNPPRAEIYLNDAERPVGITGLNDSIFLTVGQHAVTLKKNGYISKKIVVDIDEETQPVYNASLLRLVRFYAKDENKPEGGDIGASIVELRSKVQNRRPRASTPARLRLLPIRYTAVLRRSGYADKYVSISPGQKNVVVEMASESAKVSLFILNTNNNAPVKGSQVFFKGIDQGDTEKRLGTTNSDGMVMGYLPPGNYNFTVKKSGYEISTQSLRVKADQRNKLTFRIVAVK